MANSSASTSLRQPNESHQMNQSEIEEEETKVYVAIPKDLKEGSEMVSWVLRNTSTDNKIVFFHVHRTSRLLPFMGAMVPASKLDEEQVRKYRLQERMMVEKSLDECLVICSNSKFRAEKLVIENDDVGLGIVELVASHRVTMLVMGAAADRHYSRDAAINESSSSSSSHLDQLRSKSLPLRQPNHLNWVISPMRRLASENAVPYRRRLPMLKFPFSTPFRVPTATSGSSPDESVTYPWESGSRSSQSSSDSNCLWASADDFNSTNGTVSNDDGDSSSVMVTSQQDLHNLQLASTFHELQGGDFARDVYDRLEQVQTEAENFNHEAPWNIAELQKILANNVKMNESLKNDQDEMLQKLQKVQDDKEETGSSVDGLMHLLKESEDKNSKAQQNFEKLRCKQEELKQARDNAMRKAQILRHWNGETSGGDHEQVKISVFSYSELQEATKNFSDMLHIGEGRYGKIFKGFLRGTTFAIKLLNLRGMQGQAEFVQEVEVLSSVRHPNLVTLIGTCPEASALVYEYLPQGSLEDRLACKDKTDPLPWNVRIRIAAEICSALIFLRSNKPHSIVHIDLKPSNILLDANFHCKLSGFGISQLLSKFNTSYHTDSKDTLVNMDADFISSGDVTLPADVYCFGIILLCLLTGKPALGIINQVQEAVNKDKLHSMLDVSAGKWPYIQAKQLAQLALKCCDGRRKNRPSLEVEVWKVLEPIVVKEFGKLYPLSCSSVSKKNINMPSYFICPISQEVMRDPHIAEDGFTYEAEVIKLFFESGHNTSPVTNHQFQHHDLVPNLGLRSFIQEWLQMNG